jgi:EAL and modified HD-GYP domain-containing signal transduction protein
VAQCRQYNARLLADNVNTPADIACCQDLGFDYLQGAVFGPYDKLEWHRSPTYRSGWLHLMTYLINPMANMDMIETIIRHDLSLTYKLLRLVHAGFCASRPPITSMRQVLQTIGIRALITWVSFVLLSEFDDTPHEMANTAVVRAHMCEFLAQAEGLTSTDTFFLIGLLSGLDTLLDRPMSELLDTLPLHDAIRQSLLGHKGDFSRILRAVFAYEQGRWDDIQALAIDSSTITDSYLQAIVQMESHRDVK